MQLLIKANNTSLLRINSSLKVNGQVSYPVLHVILQVF